MPSELPGLEQIAPELELTALELTALGLTELELLALELLALKLLALELLALELLPLAEGARNPKTPGWVSRAWQHEGLRT